ncbi:MAG: hypothetical protein ABIP51_23240, partial [Bacteroidia bacterium]
QIPGHNHNVTDPGHAHAERVYQAINNGGNNPAGFRDVTPGIVTTGLTTGTNTTGISIQSTGGGLSHENRPPSIYLYYIAKIKS